MITKWLVCRCLTCKVHPKTPIISIAMHRYSEKTSHHGFRTRYFEFSSEPRFLNSPTGIILAAAPHWWKRRRTENTEAKIGFQHSVVSGDHLVKGFKVIWHKKAECAVMFGFVTQRPTTSFEIMYLCPSVSVCSYVGGFKVDELVWQHVTTTKGNSSRKGLKRFFFCFF